MKNPAPLNLLSPPGGLVRALLGGVAVLALASCQTMQTDSANLDSTRLFAAEPVKVEQGKASFYYGRWIGRLTANGETYRKDDVTAAHKSLPFNSYVRVHNLANDRSMIVRINNRGPFIRGRIIDLSIRAADHLQMRRAGVVPVRIEVLDPVADHEEIAQYIRECQFAEK